MMPLSVLSTLLLVSGLALTTTTNSFRADEPDRPRALLFAGVEPDPAPAALSRHVTEVARAAGYAVAEVDFDELTQGAALDPTRVDLLVLARGRGLPADALPVIESWLKAGGNLLALGLPLWQDPLFGIGDRWISRSEYAARVAVTPASHTLEDFQQTDLTRWTRHTDRPDNPVRHALVQGDRNRALHVDIGRVTGWETFASPAWETPFPPNHSLTCLRARGGPHTRSLILEWAERDGSRWIATLEITPEWRSYTLAPEAFKAWQPPAGRGGPGDRLNVTNALRFTVGVATSHHAIADPRQEYWIDDLGTAPNPFGDAAAPPDFQPPHLESLCPGYQFFDVTTRVQVRPSHEKMAIEPWERRDRVDDWAFEPAYAVRAIHPRPRGIGFDQGRPWRWEPLLGAYDPRSPRVVPWRAGDPNLMKFAGVDALPVEMPDYRGALAMLLVHVEPPYRGGVWAGFTPSEPHFFQQPLVTQALRQVLERMRRGLFLVEGGTDPITVPGRIVDNAGERYVRDEGEVRLGARVINAGKSPARVEVVVTLGMNWNPGTLGGFRKELTLVPGQVEAVQGTVWVGDTTVAEIDLYSVNDPADLTRNKWLDALRHDAKVWYPGYPHGPCLDGEPEFVRLVPGGLQYRGEPWKAHGVNYLPSSGIGLNHQTWFEHWLGRGAYDPSVIQRDLERIRSLGFNSVSAFIYYRSLDAGHLFDFLRRCEALGLLVNLSLRPGTPMDFRWPEMKAMIEHYQLASHPTVMAYDLAWEPSHYDETYQRRHPGFATPSCPFSGPRWAIMCGMKNA